MEAAKLPEVATRLASGLLGQSGVGLGEGVLGGLAGLGASIGAGIAISGAISGVASAASNAYVNGPHEARLKYDRRTVISDVSHRIVQRVADSFMTNDELTTTNIQNQPGTQWEFVFRIHDTCEGSVVHTGEYVVTNGDHEPPCCLPGSAVSAEVQHGACHAASDGSIYVFDRPPANKTKETTGCWALSKEGRDTNEQAHMVGIVAGLNEQPNALRTDASPPSEKEHLFWLPPILLLALVTAVLLSALLTGALWRCRDKGDNTLSMI